MAKKKKQRQVDVPLKLTEVDVGDSIRCGFRVEWLSASGKGLEADLCAGAGCGSPWGLIHVKYKDQERIYRFDARELLNDVIRLAQESIDALPS